MSNSIRSSEVSNKTLKKGPRNGGLPQGSSSSFENDLIAPTSEEKPLASVENLVSPSVVEAIDPAAQVSVPKTEEVSAPVEVVPDNSTMPSSTLPKKKR